jgi:hypothetical protein
MLVAAPAGAEPSLPADFILVGASIFTADDARPAASALAVRDGVIVFVGADAAAEELVGAETKVLRLAGQSVLPGLHDSHVHPMNGGMRRLRCDLTGAKSRRAIYARARDCAALPRAESWFVGFGVDFSRFGKTPPTRAELDAISPDAPAFLASNHGTVAWVNTRALAAAGLPLDRGAVVNGDTAAKVRAAIPTPSAALYRRALAASLAALARRGVTSLIDASATPEMIDAYIAADAAGEISLRIAVAQRVASAVDAAQVADMAARAARAKSDRLRADAAKFFLDGDFIDHGAALNAPYSDAPAQSGGLRFGPDRFKRLVDALADAGFQIHVHALGDAAARLALDAIGDHAPPAGAAPLRHHLAHLGLVDPADLARFAALGVAASYQPTMPFADESAAARLHAQLGPDRAARVYPFGALAAAGAAIVIGSDWPSASDAPLTLVAMALAREQPGSALDLPRFLRALTIDAAIFARQDGRTGSLTVGKAADLVVFDRNLLRTAPGRLARARALMTMVDGRAVHCAADFECPQ